MKNKFSLKNLNDRKIQLVLVILLIGFYLRIQGIYYGLPYVLNPQESSNLLGVIAPFKNILKFNTIHLPALFVYLNSIILYISSVTIDLTNILFRVEADPGSLYVPLRFLSVLFGVGSILIVYLIGSMFGFISGIIASGFMSVSFLHVKLSQLFLPFSAITFFALLSTFYALKALNENNKNEKEKQFCNLSILFALISASFNYFGIVSIVPILLVSLLNKDFEKLKSKFILFLVIFLVINPYFIFSFKSYFQSYVKSFYGLRFSSYLLPIDYLLHGIGPIAFFGALYLIKLKKHFNESNLKIIFCFPLIYFGLIRLFHMTDSGYTMALVPYFCIAAGLALSLLHSALEMKFIYIALLSFGFWIPFKYSMKYNKMISLPDTRIIATNWVKEHTSENVKIAWDKNSIQLNWHDAYNKNELKNIIDEPDLLVSKQKFSVTPEFLKRKDWFLLLRKKVDYVIIDSIDYEAVLRQPGNNVRKQYYSKLLKLKPFIVISPYLKESNKQTSFSTLEDLYSPFKTLWERERAGPIIKIYKL